MCFKGVEDFFGGIVSIFAYHAHTIGISDAVSPPVSRDRIVSDKKIFVQTVSFDNDVMAN